MQKGEAVGASWEVIAPLIAMAITLAAMQAAVALTGAIRSRDYRRFEDKSSEALAEQFPMPTADQSAADERRRAISPFVGEAHKAANAAQTSYHNTVVRSAGCLALAFSALAFGTLPPEFWPLKAPLDWPSIELVLSWLEVFGLLFMLLLFVRGQMTRRPWIMDRIGTELRRQYQILSVVFPDAISTTSAGAFKAQLETEANLIANDVQHGPFKDIVTRVERFWKARRAIIESHTLTHADLTVDALFLYLERRARRQLGWFPDSKARLEHIAERRAIVLVSLYCVAVGLALLKHFLFLHDGQFPAYLVPPLLLATGLSAAMTAYYINQNSRSLIHRYTSQQRIANRWLAAFKEQWNFATFRSPTIDPLTKSDIRTRILLFEDLMIEEAIDWVYITSHDTIELAP
jgi:hypothetical protein